MNSERCKQWRNSRKIGIALPPAGGVLWKSSVGRRSKALGARRNALRRATPQKSACGCNGVRPSGSRLIGELRAAGFRWEAWLATHPPVLGDHGELTRVQRAGSHRLVEIVEAQAALMRQAELSAALQQQRTYLAGFPQSEAAAILLQVQDGWDVETYEEACRELARLEGVRKTYEMRLALLARTRKRCSRMGARHHPAPQAV